MSHPTPTPPPAPQVRLMFEPSHLAAGCLAAVYARLVPRTPRVRPALPPVSADLRPSAPAAASTPGGTQP